MFAGGAEKVDDDGYAEVGVVDEGFSEGFDLASSSLSATILPCCSYLLTYQLCLLSPDIQRRYDNPLLGCLDHMLHHMNPESASPTT